MRKPLWTVGLDTQKWTAARDRKSPLSAHYFTKRTEALWHLPKPHTTKPNDLRRESDRCACGEWQSLLSRALSLRLSPKQLNIPAQYVHMLRDKTTERAILRVQVCQLGDREGSWGVGNRIVTVGAPLISAAQIVWISFQLFVFAWR